ncbi:pentapeptide repeat-containing protein [Micromonospora chalcea]|uniref:pentapeptide repeat-containing protein n=1 Tax=Micromonospora chalcea TaxID=1874 RepID=UPI00332C4443
MELTPAAPIELKPDPWQRLLALGSILSVIVLGIGLFVTNAANRDQQEATRRQQDLAAAGQIADRFTQAIDQLGQPGVDKIDVRLGALYSLERIMRDSAVDQPAVVEVIAAFVRVHAPASGADPRAPAASPRALRIPATPVDIQAAVTVLGRRNRDYDHLPDGLNLVATNLGGANLTNAKLNSARLDDADLRYASMGQAQLTAAFLGRANLYGSAIDQANLNRAILFNADLRYAHMWDTDLTSAVLIRSDLRYAQMQNADLTRADLRGADLRGADMYGATLAMADLTGADLRGAVNLTNDDVRCAKMDDRTQLPDGIARPGPLDDLDLERCRFK